MRDLQTEQYLHLNGFVWWFDEIAGPGDGLNASCSMIAVLQQLLRWIGEGHALAQQWCQLAERLQPVYDRPFKEGQGLIESGGGDSLQPLKK